MLSLVESTNLKAESIISEEEITSTPEVDPRFVRLTKISFQSTDFDPSKSRFISMSYKGCTKIRKSGALEKKARRETKTEPWQGAAVGRSTP